MSTDLERALKAEGELARLRQERAVWIAREAECNCWPGDPTCTACCKTLAEAQAPPNPPDESDARAAFLGGLRAREACVARVSGAEQGWEAALAWLKGSA